jgi:hypothetical protein
MSAPIDFTLLGLDAEQTSAILEMAGDYTAPAAFTLPTVTMKMNATDFGSFLKLELTEVGNQLAHIPHPGSEALYFSEDITFHIDETLWPNLQSNEATPKLLSNLPLVNTPIQSNDPVYIDQRTLDTDYIGPSIVHEQALQLTNARYMDDQVSNKAALEGAIEAYLAPGGAGVSTLLGFIRAQLALASGQTNSDHADTNVGRELFMMVVESSVGGLAPGVSATNDRVQRLFSTDQGATSNAVDDNGVLKHAFFFEAGDSIRFSVTFKGTQNEHLQDGAIVRQMEDRAVEIILQLE